METQTDTPGTVAALVLAAGRGIRFGGHKLTASYRGEPMVRPVLKAVQALRTTGHVADAIAVVPEADRPLQDLVHEAGCRVVRQSDPTRGKQDSLARGLGALTGHAAALILLGDQPLVDPEVARRLIEEWRRYPEAIVRPHYEGEPGIPGHPVVAPARWWRLADAGEPGFSHAELAGAPVWLVPVPGRNPDVDTVADLLALEGA